MKDLLQPQVLSKIEEAEAKFGERAMVASELMDRSFLAMQGKAGTLKTLENGTQVITRRTGNNKVAEYISKDGNKIDKIILHKDGQPFYSVDFYRSHQPSAPIDIIDHTTGERMTFLTSGKNARLHEWICSGGLEPEKLISFQYSSRVGGYRVYYTGNKARDILGVSI